MHFAKNIKPIPGIYKITCLTNFRSYVGQSVNVLRRLREHYRELERGYHKNDRLQIDWTRYGSENFRFEIIEYCQKWQLDGREAYWIKRLGYYNEVRPDIPKWVLLGNRVVISILLVFLIFVVFII